MNGALLYSLASMTIATAVTDHYWPEPPRVVSLAVFVGSALLGATIGAITEYCIRHNWVLEKQKKEERR